MATNTPLRYPPKKNTGSLPPPKNKTKQQNNTHTQRAFFTAQKNHARGQFPCQQQQQQTTHTHTHTGCFFHYISTGTVPSLKRPSKQSSSPTRRGNHNPASPGSPRPAPYTAFQGSAAHLPNILQEIQQRTQPTEKRRRGIGIPRPSSRESTPSEHHERQAQHREHGA